VPDAPNTHTFKPYKPSTLPAMLAPIVRPKPVEESVLSQEPAVKIPRGWKKADGKTRHVTAGKVDTLHRCGATHKYVDASHWVASWVSADRDLDIIAYRVCKPVKNQKVFSSKASVSKKRKTVTARKKK